MGRSLSRRAASDLYLPTYECLFVPRFDYCRGRGLVVLRGARCARYAHMLRKTWRGGERERGRDIYIDIDSESRFRRSACNQHDAHFLFFVALCTLFTHHMYVCLSFVSARRRNENFVSVCVRGGFGF